MIRIVSESQPIVRDGQYVIATISFPEKVSGGWKASLTARLGKSGDRWYVNSPSQQTMIGGYKSLDPDKIEKTVKKLWNNGYPIYTSIGTDEISIDFDKELIDRLNAFEFDEENTLEKSKMRLGDITSAASGTVYGLVSSDDKFAAVKGLCDINNPNMMIFKSDDAAYKSSMSRFRADTPSGHKYSLRPVPLNLNSGKVSRIEE